MANVLGELFQDIADAIRSKTGEAGSMKPAQFPAAIAGLSGTDTDEIDQRLDEILGEVVGQSLRHVTVMSEDGMARLCVIPVYEGYDAEDPFGTDPLEIPTKESTNTKHFTYTGLSLTPGGAADPSALKNVTKDRTVYVAFKATTRTYQVRFFDGDELKKTVNVTYNGSASYTLADKTGWLFRGWNPAPKNITADTDCHAVWEELLSFADATWAKINEVCESGHAADHFAIDDEREITGKDGTAYVLRVVGINLDTKATGGKAGVTVAITKPGREKATSAAWKSDQKRGVYWDYADDPTDESLVRYRLNSTFKANLPNELQGIIKTVKKRTLWQDLTSGELVKNVRESLEDLFVPSLGEILKDVAGSYSEDGVKYPGFETDAQKKLYSGTQSEQWYLRNVAHSANGTVSAHYWDSTSNLQVSIKYTTTSRGLYPCFCI